MTLLTYNMGCTVDSKLIFHAYLQFLEQNFELNDCTNLSVYNQNVYWGLCHNKFADQSHFPVQPKPLYDFRI